MNNRIIKTLYMLCLVGIVLTLVKGFGAYRIYTVDIFLLPLVAFVVTRILGGDPKMKFRWRPIDTTVVLLMLAVIVSTIFSENRARSMVPFCDWCRIFVFWFITRAVANSHIPAPSLERTLFWIGVGLVMIGMIQKFSGTSVGLIGNYVGDSLEQGTSVVNLGDQRTRRISGTTTNPNVFGQWINLFGVFVILQAFHKKRYLFCISFGAACLLVVLFTAARGNLIAIFVSALVFLWLTRAHVSRLVLPVLFVAGIGIIGVIAFSEQIKISEGVDIIVQRFNKGFVKGSASDDGRMTVGKMGIELLQKSPKNLFLGVGGHNFFPAYYRFAKNAPLGFQRSGVHNVWLKAATEYGIIVAGLLALFFLQAMLLATKCVATIKQHGELLWPRFLVVVLVSYLLVSSQLYESAISYHVLIPLFAMIAFAVSRYDAYLQFKFRQLRQMAAIQQMQAQFHASSTEP